MWERGKLFVIRKKTKTKKTWLNWQDWAWCRATAGLLVSCLRRRQLVWSTARRPSSLPSIRFLLRRQPATAATAATWAELPATRSTFSPSVPLRRSRPPHLPRQWSGSIRPAAPYVPHRWDSTPKIADPLHLSSWVATHYFFFPDKNSFTTRKREILTLLHIRFSSHVFIDSRSTAFSTVVFVSVHFHTLSLENSDTFFFFWFGFLPPRFEIVRKSVRGTKSLLWYTRETEIERGKIFVSRGTGKKTRRNEMPAEFVLLPYCAIPQFLFFLSNESNHPKYFDYIIRFFLMRWPSPNPSSCHSWIEELIKKKVTNNQLNRKAFPARITTMQQKKNILIYFLLFSVIR